VGSSNSLNSRLERLAQLEEEITSCRLCPRLVDWREKVAREKKAAHAGEEYWGRPIPGFGDLEARVVVLGLAPAAHGANRTGRFFTGDRSGDFLFGALHRTGFANTPISRRADDGLRLSGLWISAAVRCAPPKNRPNGTPVSPTPPANSDYSPTRGFSSASARSPGTPPCASTRSVRNPGSPTVPSTRRPPARFSSVAITPPSRIPSLASSPSRC
jgi:uracil-DNA glycosylase